MSVKNRGEHRSLAVREWHRTALEINDVAYDLDASGEFAGKCKRCLLDLYVWEDSRDPSRATSYTEATARSLGIPGFFIHFDADADDNLVWLNANMVYPEKKQIGDAGAFRRYLLRLRRFHQLVYHNPAGLLALEPERLIPRDEAHALRELAAVYIDGEAA